MVLRIDRLIPYTAEVRFLSQASPCFTYCADSSIGTGFSWTKLFKIFSSFSCILPHSAIYLPLISISANWASKQQYITAKHTSKIRVEA